MEVTPGRHSSAKETTSLPRSTVISISGSSTEALSHAARQTSGVGGFHLNKSMGRATVELNVDAPWFDTTMSNSFNPARATKAEVDSYEAFKASINPTLGSPITRRGVNSHVRNQLGAGIHIAKSQLVPGVLSDSKLIIVQAASSDARSPSTPRLGHYRLTGIGAQLGSTNVYPDRRLSFPSSSERSISTSQLATEQILHSLRPHANSLQTVRSQVRSYFNRRQPNSQSVATSPSSGQGSPCSQRSNDPTKTRCQSNFEGDINRESLVSKIVGSPIQRPTSTFGIDPNRGPPHFKPRTMDHSGQSNSSTAAYENGMMLNTNQPSGSHTAYNGSENSFGPMAQAHQPYDSAGAYNHFANPNGAMPSFNQPYPLTDAYNPSMATGGTLPQASAVFNPDAQYAAPGYQGGLMVSNNQYSGFSGGFIAPGNPNDPMTQFKQPYHQHASYGSPGKQNALLEEINRTLGAFRPFSPNFHQNIMTAQGDQFYRPNSAGNAQGGQGYATMEGMHASLNSGQTVPPKNLPYGSYGGNAGSESHGGGMTHFPGFSGPPGLYAPSEGQGIGMQNFSHHTSSTGTCPAPGEEAAGILANLNQNGFSSTSFASLEAQPKAMVSANQSHGLPPAYGLFEPKGGLMSQVNQFNRSNAPSPAATFIDDGSRASPFASSAATVGNESLGTSPKTTEKPAEMHTPQTQSPLQAPTLKNYFGPNPFGPIAPPSGPIRLPPTQPTKPSWHLHYIAPNGIRPQVDMALDSMNLPFTEMCRNTIPWNKGVLRIINIPWNVNRAEILAFLGRNAQVKESEEPVHIILDRFSGKTMEAYVEFEDMDEVMNAVNRYYQNKERGRSGRLGDRHVCLEVSCQEALMKALFPKAKNVTWNGPRPVIDAKDPNDAYNSGFQGFLTKEELLLLTKCVEQPQRTPYGVKCPQRPFESIISIIKKYPWYMVDHITLEDRDLLFQTAAHLTAELYKKIQEDSQHVDLNYRLLRRLQLAIFKCHGFTQAQKDDICFICDLNPTREGLAPYADHWYVLKAIGPKPNALHDVILFYMALLREATTLPGKVSLAERASNDVEYPVVFGNMGIEYPANVQQMTFAQVARIEWTVIEKLLRKTLAD